MTTTTTEGRVSRAQREIEVAGLVRAGLSREDIAALLTRAARLLRNDPDIEFVQALWDRAAQFEAIDD